MPGTATAARCATTRTACRFITSFIAASAAMTRPATSSRSAGAAMRKRTARGSPNVTQFARRPRFADGGVRWGQKPARPLRGSAAPPYALAAPSRAAAAAGGPSGRLPPSYFFGVVAVGSSGATPPPSPRSPVLLRAAKVGGLAPAAFGRRAAAAARPSAPAPPPRFWPRGGAILFSLRRVWGLRRLRAALKVYRAARAAQCGCGVHGFAMNPCDSAPIATAPYYREARVTSPRRQTACRMRHCWRSPH